MQTDRHRALIDQKRHQQGILSMNRDNKYGFLLETGLMPRSFLMDEKGC
jgi:hypothetical protein